MLLLVWDVERWFCQQSSCRRSKLTAWAWTPLHDKESPCFSVYCTLSYGRPAWGQRPGPHFRGDNGSTVFPKFWQTCVTWGVWPGKTRRLSFSESRLLGVWPLVDLLPTPLRNQKRPPPGTGLGTERWRQPGKSKTAVASTGASGERSGGWDLSTANFCVCKTGFSWWILMVGSALARHRQDKPSLFKLGTDWTLGKQAGEEIQVNL